MRVHLYSFADIRKYLIPHCVICFQPQISIPYWILEGVSKDHFKAELQIPLNAIILF